MGAKFTFQHVEQGFLVWRGFRWGPEVPAVACPDGCELLVDDVQCPAVRRPFCAVTEDLGADGIGAAELFGKHSQAGAGDA